MFLARARGPNLVPRVGLLNTTSTPSEANLTSIQSMSEPSLSENFSRACVQGDLDSVRSLLEGTQVNLDARNTLGLAPLHLLAAQPVGHLHVVKYLCEQGADKEARCRYGMTPLQKAAYMGFLPVVQYLCEQGADKEARGDYGMTPLRYAAREGHLPVVQYLRKSSTTNTPS